MAKILSGARHNDWALAGFLVSALLFVLPADATGNAGAVSFSKPLYAVTADAGVVLVTIDRTGGSAGGASASYVTIQSSAIAGSDFSATQGTVNWTDGDTAPKTFMVPIASTGAGSVAFNVALLSAVGVSFGVQTSATVYIYPGASNGASIVTIGGAAGSIQFSQADYSVALTSSSMTASLNRVGGSSGTAIASFTTLDSTAVAGVNYDQTSGTVSWGDGDSTPRSVAIPLIANSAVPGQSFRLALISASGAAFGNIIDATVSIRQTGTGSAALYWTAPTQNTDGSPITDLSGYYIYYGSDPTQPMQILSISDPSATSVQLGGLVNGTWYFAAAAYNSLGIASDLSAVASTTMQ